MVILGVQVRVQGGNNVHRLSCDKAETQTEVADREQEGL